MAKEHVLSLLGLALRGGNLAVGEEPVEAVARAKDARLLILACDAADNTRRRVEHFANAGDCIWTRVPCTKAELGQAVGKPAIAIVALTDIGLAAAVAHRLEELDPQRYHETAQRLDLKAQRAAQRRKEQLAHEKNVRQGKHKVKAVASAPKQEEKPAPAPKKPAAGKRPSKENRPKPRAKANPYAHSRPVKKGKGSFRKKDASKA